MNLRTFAYRRWSGGERTVEATEVQFHTAHVIFYGHDGVIVLAERVEQVNELREVVQP